MEIPKTEKSYLILVNKEELLLKAEELGYDNMICITDLTLTDEQIDEVAKSGKSVVLVRYHHNRDAEEGTEKQLRNKGIDVLSESCCYQSDESTLEEFINGFPVVEQLEFELDSYGMIYHTDYQGRCGNCHAHMDEDDKYCKCCGTKRGEGAFEPYNNMMQIIYGPPYVVRYICDKCNHDWTEEGLGYPDEKYCPKCGEKIKEDNMIGDFPVKDKELEMNIDELELSVKTYHYLRENGVMTVEDLIYCTEGEVLEYCNNEDSCLQEVIDKLDEIGEELL